jgi:hypothetical protein
MKKYLTILIGVLLISMNANGQWYSRYYPGKSLSDMNQDELSFLYGRATSLRHTGTVIMIAGVGTMAAGGVCLFSSLLHVIFTAGREGEGIGAFSMLLIIASPIILSAGVAPLLIGRDRQKQVNSYLKKLSVGVSLCSISSAENNFKSGISPGLRLSLTF